MFKIFFFLGRGEVKKSTILFREGKRFFLYRNEVKVLNLKNFILFFNPFYMLYNFFKMLRAALIINNLNFILRV